MYLCGYVFYLVFSSICFPKQVRALQSSHLYPLALKFAAPTSRIFPCNNYYYYIIIKRVRFAIRERCVYRVVRGKKIITLYVETRSSVYMFIIYSCQVQLFNVNLLDKIKPFTGLKIQNVYIIFCFYF